MTAPAIELADIVRQYAPGFLDAHRVSLPFDQLRALADIASCRTAPLGGHVDVCPECGFQQISYNSCRNRHCPKCQASQAAQWAAACQDDLLPVSYFHVVFTLPDSVGHLALQNKRLVYGMLFAAASRTLLRIAADQRHLGARIGFLAVLHTWGQNLHHHPHLHCLVPGGGIAPDGSRWVPSREHFFLPIHVLSAVYRGKFIHLLRRAYDRQELELHGRLAYLASPDTFEDWLRTLAQQDWVVYAKPPFGGPLQVVRYLARYTHRVAISNRRLVSMDASIVSFHWRDYASGGQTKLMRLTAHEFLRRFLLHILPKGFRRIRHYGFLASRVRASNLELCRRLLGAQRTTPDPFHPLSSGQRSCPNCGHVPVLSRQLPRILNLGTTFHLPLPMDVPLPVPQIHDTS